MHGVVTTSVFEAQAARAGLTENEVVAIVSWLSAHPQAGVLIPGAGGARKVRFAGRGKGKSGGYRTIHYFGGEDVPLFLLALVDKGRQADISQAAKAELARVLPHIAAAYRAGVKAGVVKIGKRT